MPLKRIGLRAWTLAAVLIAAYIAAGFWLEHNDQVEMWTYKAGLAAATLVPLAFTAIYTVFGLTGHAKWWRNTIGVYLVGAGAGLVIMAAPLGYTFWADGGNLTPSWWAWAEVSGPVVSALIWGGLCILWLRIHAAAGREEDGE